MNETSDGRSMTELGMFFGEGIHKIGRFRRRLAVCWGQFGVFFVLFLFLMSSLTVAWCFHDGCCTWCSLLRVMVFACSLLAFAGWMLYFLHPYFRRWWVRVSVGCVLFVWGFCTFFYFPVEESDAGDFWARMLRATNRASVTMFTRQGRLYGKPLSLAGRVNYGAFQTCLILYVAAILFSVFGRTAMNGLQKFFVWNDDRLHVFWGLSERDRLLARSVRKTDRHAQIEFNLPRSLMHDQLGRSRLTDLADELKAFWMFVNLAPNDNDALSSRKAKGPSRIAQFFVNWGLLGLSVAKGRYHYFLGDDGHANMALADRLLEVITDKQSALFGEWRFFVRAGDVDNEGFFLSWADRWHRKSGRMVSISIIRDAELTARDFVSRYPPVSAKCLAGHIDTVSATVDDRRCRTLLLGFDRTGRELLNVCLCISGFIGTDGKRVVQFPFTVVDMKPERWERYRLAVPGIFDDGFDYAIDFQSMQIGRSPFDSWLRRNHGNYDRIVLCMSDDAANIREGLRIREILQEEFADDKEIYLRIRNPLMSKSLAFERTVDGKFKISTFGDLRSLYSAGAFNAAGVDRMAKAINWAWHDDSGNSAWLLGNGRAFYKDLQDEIDRHWMADGMYNRRSSQVQALRCLTFCRIWKVRLGLLNGVERLLQMRDESGEEGVAEFEELSACVDTALKSDVLPRMEHHRWCTFMRVCGYRSFSDKPDQLCQLKQSENFKDNQIDTFRRHAGLVDYDQLDDESKRFNRDCWKALAGAAYLAGLCRRTGDVPLTVISPWSNLMTACSRIFAEGKAIFAGEFRKPFVPVEDLRFVSRCVELADIYRHTGENLNLDGVKSAAYADFLYRSGEIRLLDQGGADDGLKVFCFNDSISPHFAFWRKRLHKTHYPYVYDMKTGMIRPLVDLISKVDVPTVLERTGVEGGGRLIDFSSQPNFVARVTKETLDGKGARPMIVVSFCGTESFKDIVEDVMQCLGCTPPQFRLAADLVKAVCLASKESGEDVLLVGHSEGGGEVQYALMRNGAWRWCEHRKIRGVTFNSQRLSPSVLQGLCDCCGSNSVDVEKNVAQMLTHYRMRYDMVSACSQIGVGLIGSIRVLDARSTSSFAAVKGFLKRWSCILQSHRLQVFKDILDEAKRVEDA